MRSIIIRKFIEQDTKDLKEIYLEIRKEELGPEGPYYLMRGDKL